MRVGVYGAGALALALAACIPDVPQSATTDTPEAPATDAGTPKDASPTASDLLSTVEKMKSVVKDRPRDYDINIALANLYYENGKYIDSIEYLTDALTPLGSAMQTLAASKPVTSPAPASCLITVPTPEGLKAGRKGRTADEVAQAAARLKGTEAQACLEQLRLSLANTTARRGAAWYLIGNAEKAEADIALSLSLNPDNAEALFYEGARLLETAKGDAERFAKGRAYWDHLLKVAPDNPHAEQIRQSMPKILELFGPKAEGQDPTAANGPGPLPPGAEAIPQNFQHTPEAEAELDKITEHAEALLKESKWADAMTEFKKVMPIRPTGRIALGMGIALRELGKPSAEMVLTQATKIPGGDPTRARFELAVFYEKNRPAAAKAIFTELQTDPKLGADAKARLAKLP